MKKKLILYIVILSVAFIVGSYLFNNWYHKNIKTQPKAYIYQTYFGPVNSALIIEDLKYKNNLINYYETIKKNPDTNVAIGVPLKTLPQFEPVYILGYSKDSLLVEVVSYYDYGRLRGGSFTKGWVFNGCVHKHPPKQ
ncbi:MAG: hypothetical protein ACLGGV_04985 [Bacteroidia bacterium]